MTKTQKENKNDISLKTDDFFGSRYRCLLTELYHIEYLYACVAGK